MCCVPRACRRRLREGRCLALLGVSVGSDNVFTFWDLDLGVKGEFEEM